METITSPSLFEQVAHYGLFTLYLALVIAAVSMPIWGYKIIESRFLSDHKALKNRMKNPLNTSGIIASLGTTTAGVFMIQILPLIFSIIGDVGGDFGISTIFGEFSPGAVGVSDYADNFYALTAQLGDMLQTVSPMAAVGLGGYNLINKLSRGLPA